MKFTFPQSTVDNLRITLIGFNLDCDLVHEFFLTVEDQGTPPTPEGCLRQRRCAFKKETRAPGKSYCDYECNCTSRLSCQININVLNPRWRVLCEISETRWFEPDFT